MRSTTKLVSLILTMSLLILSLFSCSSEVRAQYLELGIVLPDSFSEYDSGGSFDLSYTDGELIVGFTRVSFVAAMDDGIPTTLTPLKFAEVYRGRTDREDSEIFELDDIVYYEYTITSDSGTVYNYIPTFYVTPYAYFVILFISRADTQTYSRDRVLELARRVYIDNSAI